MDILEAIVEHKQKELDKLTGSQRPTAFLRMLQKSPSSIKVIAEVKFRSPTVQQLYGGNLTSLVDDYNQVADAISVVTNQRFFGSGNKDLKSVKKLSRLPVLKKDFVIHPIQIVEAKQVGADALLLIASLLSADRLADFVAMTKAIGIEPIVEICQASEIAKAVGSGASCIAVNVRDLKTQKLNKDRAYRVLKKLPSSNVKLLFSGIDGPEDVRRAKQSGAQAVLVGTALLTAENIQQKLAELKGKQ